LPQRVFAVDSFSKRVQQGSSEGVSNPCRDQDQQCQTDRRCMIMYARLWGVDRDRECYSLLIRGQGQNNKGFSLSFVPLSHLILTTRSLRTFLKGSGQHVPPRRSAQRGSRLDVFCCRFMFFHIEFYFLCFLAFHGRSRQSILSATADVWS
jgi:hypothetical protein